MKAFRLFSITFFAFFLFAASHATENQWPVTLTGADGSVIKVYEPQPESFQGNILKCRSAVSVLQEGKTDPVFGTFWAVATVETDKTNRTIDIQSVRVPNIKFPGEEDREMNASLKTTLESQLPDAVGDIPLDKILSSLEMNQDQKKLSKDLNTKAPKIIYATRPSILVQIDGEPRMQTNKDWHLDVIQNTPFTIVKNNDGKYYLYGGRHWYVASSPTGSYQYIENEPKNLQQVETDVNNARNANAGYMDSTEATRDNVVSDIIVSTEPAELLQSDGKAQLSAIDGTNLSYLSNSDNDIFLDKDNDLYYVLISGRWYKSNSLNGQWEYLASNDLPSDFSRIPEGSPKDNVLASVAGTEAAREAVMDAQIPQTARVDRKSATTNIRYNGTPQFKSIPGTELEYAINTPSSVMLYRGVYYAVDNGVWFQSNSPEGPWVVAEDRPDEVDRIPPSSPMYNTKYVYIYDVTPDYIYMGYTPGYLNTYIYGPTVVYGTGYYYDPWYDGYYYPRPWTWGFNMGYNPWCGWSIGYNYSYGWFNWGMSYGYPYPYWGGGWWGPAIYRPPYSWNHYSRYGYYSNNYYRNNNIYVNNYNVNIYRNRTGIVSRNPLINNSTFINRGGRTNPNGGRVINDRNYNQAGRPVYNNNLVNGRINQPGTAGQTRLTRPSNNVFSDRDGNVYQRNQNQWQQRQSNQWSPVQRNNNTIQNLNRQQQMRNRGEVRSQNFERVRNSPAVNVPSRPSGGGSSGRPSSGSFHRRG